MRAIAQAPAPSPSPLEPLGEQTVVVTVDQRAVLGPEFRFWLRYVAKTYRAAHGLETISDWHARQNGLELRDYLLKTAVQLACNDTALEEQASRLGVQIPAAELQALSDARRDNLRVYGSQSEYQHIVASMYGTEQVYDYLTRIDHLGVHLFDQLYGSGGELCLDACVADFVSSEELMNVQYIMLGGRDPAGRVRSPAIRRQQLRRLRSLRRQLLASRDAARLFATLMDRYSEDRSLGDYPDGHLFAQGAKGAQFAAAYRQLADDQVSDIVTQPDPRSGTSDYYLILRKPLSPAVRVDANGNTLRYWAAYQHLFKPQIGAWCAALPIRYGSAYEQIDVAATVN